MQKLLIVLRSLSFVALSSGVSVGMNHHSLKPVLVQPGSPKSSELGTPKRQVRFSFPPAKSMPVSPRAPAALAFSAVIPRNRCASEPVRLVHSKAAAQSNSGFLSNVPAGLAHIFQQEIAKMVHIVGGCDISSKYLAWLSVENFVVRKMLRCPDRNRPSCVVYVEKEIQAFWVYCYAFGIFKQLSEHLKEVEEAGNLSNIMWLGTSITQFLVCQDMARKVPPILDFIDKMDGDLSQLYTVENARKMVEALLERERAKELEESLASLDLGDDEIARVNDGADGDADDGDEQLY